MPGQVEEEMEKGGIDAVLVQDAQECGKRCASILRELYETPECVKKRRDMVACEVVEAP